MEDPLLESNPEWQIGERRAHRIRIFAACLPTLLTLVGILGLILLRSSDSNLTRMQAVLGCQIVVLAVISVIGWIFVCFPDSTTDNHMCSLAWLGLSLIALDAATISLGAPHLVLHSTQVLFAIILSSLDGLLAIWILVVYLRVDCLVQSLMNCLKRIC